MAADTPRLCVWQSSGDCRFLVFGPDDRGEAQEVAAVDAVLAGDHVGLCADGVEDETVLGEP